MKDSFASKHSHLMGSSNPTGTRNRPIVVNVVEGNLAQANAATSGGGTGGIQKNDEGQLGSSTDRISQYQNKLSSMREKFQQRKSVGSESQLNNKLT